jgi:dihydrodipicolinate synthase/N-acetylneuraminate lyase
VRYNSFPRPALLVLETRQIIVSSMLTRETFRGPWAGLPVAWSPLDEFDEQAYRHDVARCCDFDVPGVYTGGTTGEFYAMEFGEFQAVAKATVEECHARDTPAMIGCSSTYTLGAQRRAAYAAEIGADAIQLALPYWMEIDSGCITPFFRQVSTSAGDLPLSIYETTRAKVTLSLEQHIELSRELPNYMMVKANGGTIGTSLEGCKSLSEFANVFVGESLWETLGPHGALGGCSSMVYWNPEVCLNLWRAVEAQNWDAVAQQTRPVSKLFNFLHAEFGTRGYTDTAFDRLGGLASGFLKTSMRSRGPYISVTVQDVEKLRKWYSDEFPEMLVG